MKEENALEITADEGTVISEESYNEKTWLEYGWLKLGWRNRPWWLQIYMYIFPSLTVKPKDCTVLGEETFCLKANA